LPLDKGVVFDIAYLKMRFGMANKGPVPIREAHAAFVMLCEADPNNPKYWSARGVAAASLGDLVEAEKDLVKAASLAPTKSEYAETLQQIRDIARP
jgi:predicted Zn-dependent protease